VIEDGLADRWLDSTDDDGGSDDGTKKRRRRKRRIKTLTRR
jgi:hypothetical protein